MAKPEQTRPTAGPLACLTEREHADREQAEQIEKVKAGLKAANEGRFVSDADIEAIIVRFEMNA